MQNRKLGLSVRDIPLKYLKHKQSKCQKESKKFDTPQQVHCYDN